MHSTEPCHALGMTFDTDAFVEPMKHFGLRSCQLDRIEAVDLLGNGPVMFRVRGGHEETWGWSYVREHVLHALDEGGVGGVLCGRYRARLSGVFALHFNLDSWIVDGGMVARDHRRDGVRRMHTMVDDRRRNRWEHIIFLASTDYRDGGRRAHQRRCLRLARKNQLEERRKEPEIGHHLWGARVETIGRRECDDRVDQCLPKLLATAASLTSCGLTSCIGHRKPPARAPKSGRAALMCAGNGLRSSRSSARARIPQAPSVGGEEACPGSVCTVQRRLTTPFSATQIMATGRT
mmetsp:Transcript_35938/g.94522  ORF Transcript_35938/g.94522 Transcript_35938/m.94522 type:complete len:292 (-) Transcript_35938:142-1017(-)